LSPVDGGSVGVTVTELVNKNTQVLDHIQVDRFSRVASSSQTITGTNTISQDINGDFEITVTFVNRLLPGDQGCTLGYWKQSQHFDSWVTYTPGQAFSSVFEDAFPGLSLLQVLELGGGGLKALGRQTVAALLNAASGSVNFGLTTQQVIDAFNAVFPGGNYEQQKDAFASLNERTCPLH
jgi:hypothetical protein